MKERILCANDRLWKVLIIATAGIEALLFLSSKPTLGQDNSSQCWEWALIDGGGSAININKGSFLLENADEIPSVQVLHDVIRMKFDKRPTPNEGIAGDLLGLTADTVATKLKGKWVFDKGVGNIPSSSTIWMVSQVTGTYLIMKSRDKNKHCQ